MVKFAFNHSKLKNNLFLAKLLKSRGKIPLLPPSDAHGCSVECRRKQCRVKLSEQRECFETITINDVFSCSEQFFMAHESKTLCSTCPRDVVEI